jgi:tetratricopeptide (TPR) repeat protein
MVCSVLFIAVGVYVGGGFYLNAQINKSFGEKDCESVVQQASFVSTYPKGMFASMFTGYDQYAECRTKLDIDQAVAVKDWGAALALTHEYAATYPNGSFAANMDEQAAGILSDWSAELIANRNYEYGIEKIKQLVKTYPDSPSAQPALDTILQTYILWAKELADYRNHAESEKRLNAALSYFQADSARSETIHQELTNLYVDWGNMQTQIGDMDNGIKHYKMAGELSPGKIDVEILIARAYLQKAIDIAGVEDFDRALAKVQEVSDDAQSENVKSEASATQEKILAAYSDSTSQQAIDQTNAAISLTCQGKRPDLPIFGRDAKKVRFGLASFGVKLPMGWVAEKPGKLYYIICISEESEKLETCPYQKEHLLLRMRYVWQVVLYNILDGNKYDSKTFKGSDAPKCMPEEYFIESSKTKQTFGSRPTVDDIIAWLVKLNITK